ncbi:MAG: hypothetical protein MI861_06055, partial [Pirellulales bacterium]|nr:hypothetical protein [Pirellulales bacterium]
MAAITAGIAILFTTFSPAHAADEPAYGANDLTFKEIKSVDNGDVEIRFRAKPESLHFCPGA